MIKFFSKISSNYSFLAVILIDFVLKQRRKLLSASKRENRYDLEISSDDSDESDAE